MHAGRHPRSWRSLAWEQSSPRFPHELLRTSYTRPFCANALERKAPLYRPARVGAWVLEHSPSHRFILTFCQPQSFHCIQLSRRPHGIPFSSEAVIGIKTIWAPEVVTARKEAELIAERGGGLLAYCLFNSQKGRERHIDSQYSEGGFRFKRTILFHPSVTQSPDSLATRPSLIRKYFRFSYKDYCELFSFQNRLYARAVVFASVVLFCV